MKPIIKQITPIILLLLVSCQAIVGYEPGYHRISFDKWSSKSFKNIGVELQLPEEYRVDYNNDHWLRISLHTYYPQSMLAEYTATYYISVTKFTPEKYLHPRYSQENITAPYFYKETKYLNIKRENGRLRTDHVHSLFKHFRDSKGNIFVISISVYPWPNNQDDIQEDIEAGYRIIDSFNIVE